MQQNNDVATKLQFNAAHANRVRIITGAVGLCLLLAGVVCQWFAGSKMSDVPLGTLCETWSGTRDLMSETDWEAFKQDFYSNFAEDGRMLSLRDVAAEFLGFKPAGNYPIDAFLTTDPSFWCKHLPKCPDGTTCRSDAIVWRNESWVRGGAWPLRPISSEPSWTIADGLAGFYSNHIRCSDKAKVYHDMLSVVLRDMRGSWVVDPLTDKSWNEDMLGRATNEFLHACQRGKGVLTYILILGPILSSIACLSLVLSLFRSNSTGCCSSALGATMGQGFAIIAMAMVLVEFWVIWFITNNEFAQSYMFCQSRGPPLVVDGVYFDGTPCVDVDSMGGSNLNPFLRATSSTVGLYTAGGICNLLATVILLVSISMVKVTSQVQQLKYVEQSNDDDDDNDDL